MTIAIIDDDDVFQFLCSRLIAKISPLHQVQNHVDGLVAYEHFKIFGQNLDRLPHLIILDINMPSMNGWQFLEAFRSLAIPGYTPCIFIVSSTLDDYDLDRAKEFTELTGFKTKPITQAQLAEMISVAGQ